MIQNNDVPDPESGNFRHLEAGPAQFHDHRAGSCTASSSETVAGGLAAGVRRIALQPAAGIFNGVERQEPDPFFSPNRILNLRRTATTVASVRTAASGGGGRRTPRKRLEIGRAAGQVSPKAVAS